MDLKELGAAMGEALVLRMTIDSLDEKISIAGAQIDADKKEISRLEALQKVTAEAEENKQKVEKDRADKNTELVKRLAMLDEMGVKLPIREKFVARRVSL